MVRPVQQARQARTLEEVADLRSTFQDREATLREQLQDPAEQQRFRSGKSRVADQLRQITAAQTALREREKNLQQAEQRGITPEEARQLSRRSDVRERAVAGRVAREEREGEIIRDDEGRQVVFVSPRGENLTQTIRGEIRATRLANPGQDIIVERKPIETPADQLFTPLPEQDRIAPQEEILQTRVEESVVETPGGLFRPGTRTTTQTITGSREDLSRIAQQSFETGGTLTLTTTESTPGRIPARFQALDEKFQPTGILKEANIQAEQQAIAKAQETFKVAEGDFTVNPLLAKIPGVRQQIQRSAEVEGTLQLASAEIPRAIQQKPVTTTGKVALGFGIGLATAGVGSLGTAGAVSVKIAGATGGAAFLGLTAFEVSRATTREERARVIGEAGVDVLAIGTGAALGSATAGVVGKGLTKIGLRDATAGRRVDLPSLSKEGAKRFQNVGSVFGPPRAKPTRGAVVIDQGRGSAKLLDASGKEIFAIFKNKRGGLRGITIQKPKLTPPKAFFGRNPQAPFPSLLPTAPGSATFFGSALGTGLGAVAAGRFFSRLAPNTRALSFQGTRSRIIPGQTSIPASQLQPAQSISTSQAISTSIATGSALGITAIVGGGFFGGGSSGTPPPTPERPPPGGGRFSFSLPGAFQGFGRGLRGRRSLLPDVPKPSLSAIIGGFKGTPAGKLPVVTGLEIRGL